MLVQFSKITVSFFVISGYHCRRGLHRLRVVGGAKVVTGRHYHIQIRVLAEAVEVDQILLSEDVHHLHGGPHALGDEAADHGRQVAHLHAVGQPGSHGSNAVKTIDFQLFGEFKRLAFAQPL